MSEGMDNSVMASMRAQLRQAQQEAAQASEAEQRAEAAEKRAVLAELGIKPDSPQARLAERMHEGEWTTEAVLGTLTEYGAAPSQYSPELVAQHQVADGAATGTSGYISSLDELAALPAYGMPGWETAKQRAYDIVRRAGVEVTYQRPKNTDTWINPATGKPIKMTQHTPVGPVE
jgi:hypothetical protein